jgi:ribosomal protein S1
MQAITLCEGQQVRVRVLNVDATRQRLGLSLNLAEPVHPDEGGSRISSG